MYTVLKHLLWNDRHVSSYLNWWTEASIWVICVRQNLNANTKNKKQLCFCKMCKMYCSLSSFNHRFTVKKMKSLFSYSSCFAQIIFHEWVITYMWWRIFLIIFTLCEAEWKQINMLYTSGLQSLCGPGRLVPGCVIWGSWAGSVCSYYNELYLCVIIHSFAHNVSVPYFLLPEVPVR